jgi:Domain of unknown function (DUF4124)
LIVCGLLLLATPASAGIFRCVGTEGSVSYQEQPCEPGERGGAVAIPTTFPDYVAPRERLAAREAAVDARLLKRLEIESAERIARDERIARESELQAERERARAAEAWMPIFIAPPLRMHPLARGRSHASLIPRHSLPLMR